MHCHTAWPSAFATVCRFDKFAEVFSYERPHETLGVKCPADGAGLARLKLLGENVPNRSSGADESALSLRQPGRGSERRSN
jgi:hypothetical protein